MTIDAYGDELTGTCTNSGPVGLRVLTATHADGPRQAVGLDTELQRVTVSASAPIVEGEYRLAFGPFVSSCLAWDGKCLFRFIHVKHNKISFL